jgi:hypothetical protein
MSEYFFESEHLLADYDPDSRIARIIYKAVITPESTAQAYQWAMEEGPKIGMDNIYGLIYDFRTVTEFHKENFQAVKRQSSEAKRMVDMSRLPVALIVANLYQEQMLRVSTKLTGAEERAQIVYSEEEAQKHLRHWHEQHDAS